MVEEEFKTWLQRDDKDETSAFCKVCWKSFSIANSGIENVKQHAKRKKHLERCPSGNSKISFVKKPSEATNETEKAAHKTAQKQTSLIDLVSRDQTLNAEIIWSLEVLKCKYSYRSSESKSKLFCSMFPDSKIAQNFTCGKTKCSYILSHGIAPFVKETLLIKRSPILQQVV